jgi:cytochrome c551/c552
MLHRAFRHGEDDHYWNDPLTDEVTVFGQKFKGAFMQAKCDKCYAQQITLSHAPLLSKGKKLFTDVGCWGCHPIEGYNDLAKRGPTLTNIASKTTQGWLQTWISYPKGWRPGTRMPNFWPGAVDASSVPHPEDEKPEQVIASRRSGGTGRSRHVASTSGRAAGAAPRPIRAEGGREGEDLRQRRLPRLPRDREGPTARRSEGSEGATTRPTSGASPTRRGRSGSTLGQEQGDVAGTKMPASGSATEAANVTSIWRLKGGQSYPAAKIAAAEQQKLAAEGKELISKYGCFGCHNIKGFENAQKIGTELTEHGRKAVELLDFGDVRYFTEDPKHRQTYANWCRAASRDSRTNESRRACPSSTSPARRRWPAHLPQGPDGLPPPEYRAGRIQ